MQATTLSSIALLLAKVLDHGGYDSRTVFLTAGLDPSNLSDTNARYSIAKMQALWRLAFELTGDFALGLKVASYWHPTTFHALGYSVLASASLKEAMERTVRYSRIVNDTIKVDFEKGYGGYRLSLQPPQDYPQPSPESTDAAAALLLNMVRNVYGDVINPTLLTLPRPIPPCTEEFDRYFRCPIQYSGEEVSLHFLPEDIEKSLPTGNAELAQANDKIIKDYLAHLNRSQVSMQIKAKLINALPSGTITEQDMAIKVHMSLRSLQRKLKEEGTCFKEILDETRRELATQYVNNSRLTLGEITFLLGFSEHANFTRAFKRWHGVAPSDYRREIGMQTGNGINAKCAVP